MRDFEIIIKIKYYVFYRVLFMLGFKNRVIVEVRVVDKVFGSLKSLFFLFFVLDGFGMVAFFFVCRLVI